MFRQMLAEFIGCPEASIAIMMLHLPAAREREAGMKALEEALGPCPLEIREAVDGRCAAASGLPRACYIQPGLERTPGELGCLLSHVGAIKEALQRPGISHLVLFEDDCSLKEGGLEGLRAWFREALSAARRFGVPDPFEFFLLGSMGAYFHLPFTRGTKLVQRFNGSHAVCLGRSMMEKVVRAHEIILREHKKIAPIDGLYSLVLCVEDRWVLSPVRDTAFFVQKRDIPSYVVADEPAKIGRAHV